MSKYSQCTDTYEKINGAVLYGMLHFFNFYLVRENPKTPKFTERRKKLWKTEKEIFN